MKGERGNELSKDTLIIDGDALVYSSGFVGERRELKAVHKQTGDEFTFKGRTEMYGKKRSKDGGWLAEINNTKETPWTVDDFDLFDIQIPAHVEFSLQATKSLILKATELTGIKERRLFVGKGESQRVEQSTLIKYKSGREGLLRPIHKDAIVEYMVKYHNAEVVEGVEVDDRVTMLAWEDHRNVIYGIDKDYLGTNSRVFNPNTPEKGIQDCRCWGDLWVEEIISKTTGKKRYKVKGYGRKWFLHQWCYGDDSDSYRSNCASELEWGEMASYNVLKDARNNREGLEAIVSAYKTLYPTPREVVGWRGDNILCDWKYVSSEIFQMAHMLRTPEDDSSAEKVLSRYGLWE